MIRHSQQGDLSSKNVQESLASLEATFKHKTAAEIK